MSLPHLWIFAGPNGGGKSTLAQRYVARKIEIINPDNIALEIAPNQQTPPATASKAGRIAIERRHALLKLGQSFAIETTLSGQGECAFMKDALDRGFKINLVFVGVSSVLQSRSRVAERILRGGHTVPPADIEQRFGRSMTHLVQAIQIAHRVLLLDNSSKRLRLLVSCENGRVKHISAHLPRWVQTVANSLIG
ncbi:AAA family ATPase [Zymomonas mobilis]|uniref:AAA family ATPase n=1 Tax=Zymomonas mobilis TaxID=542 RepID=UPI000784E748|nr:AAA family ATPase [Zymomonas mobilis]